MHTTKNMTATDRKTMSTEPKLYSVLVYTDAAPASFLAVKSLAYADPGGRDAESRPILWTLEATGQEGDYTLLLVDVSTSPSGTRRTQTRSSSPAKSSSSSRVRPGTGA